MTAEDSVRKFTAQYRLAAVPRANCLMLDSEAQSAEANAKEIIRHFGLADLRPV
jgi:hypothetical protein